MNSTVYTLKENNWLFSSKIYSATKHSSPPNVYFYGIFSQRLIEYSLIKIEEFEFTLKIQIWCRNLGILKNALKTRDQTPLL